MEPQCLQSLVQMTYSLAYLICYIQIKVMNCTKEDKCITICYFFIQNNCYSIMALVLFNLLWDFGFVSFVVVEL